MTGVWMDGWMDGWTDPSVVRAQEMQERVGVVAEQAKKWQLPCKSAWALPVWLCLMLMFSRVCVCAACSSGSRVLVYPFPDWEAAFAVAKTRFCGGSCKAVGTTPVTFPFGIEVLACMRWHIPPKIRFPHQPLPAWQLVYSTVIREKPFPHRITSPPCFYWGKKKTLAVRHHASLGLGTTLGSLMHYSLPTLSL